MNILLADDNPKVRSALRLLLEQEPFWAVVTEAADAQGLLGHLAGNGAKVVLLDWELPGGHENEFLSQLRSRFPGLKVIALSSKFEARQAALAAGVDAFVSKAEPPEKIINALRFLVPEP